MKQFSYQLNINASQEEVYNALTNSFQIELWTGFPAVMDANVGTEFSLWEGDICGKNLQMIQDYKIVQQWYFGETEAISEVTLILKKSGKDTIVKLEHTNIPEDVYDEIVEGWKQYYLEAVKRFLEFY